MTEEFDFHYQFDGDCLCGLAHEGHVTLAPKLSSEDNIVRTCVRSLPTTQNGYSYFLPFLLTLTLTSMLGSWNLFYQLSEFWVNLVTYLCPFTLVLIEDLVKKM